MFISFEGIDASGKSTQIAAMAAFLREKHIDFVQTREPGGTPAAESIREFVLNTRLDSPLAEALMMNAARHLHVRDVIAPALKAQKWVLCDRFYHSTCAYQAEAGGENLQKLHRLAANGLMPDVTFLLDIPLETVAGRRDETQDDVFEQRADLYKKRLCKQYRQLKTDKTPNYHIIDGTHTPDRVTREIFTIMAQYCPEVFTS